jgi:hypothetical protein|tara:strand:+ start:273 stop:614 length:342 start_codon:yes stop_codon:yes gene_type:complete
MFLNFKKIQINQPIIGTNNMPMIKITKSGTLNKKKEIMNILNQTQQVFVYNSVVDYHFKASKAEFVQLFKRRYASQLTVTQSDGSLDFYYMNEFLDEFKNNCNLNSYGQLFFN